MNVPDEKLPHMRARVAEFHAAGHRSAYDANGLPVPVEDGTRKRWGMKCEACGYVSTWWSFTFYSGKWDHPPCEGSKDE